MYLVWVPVALQPEWPSTMGGTLQLVAAALAACALLSLAAAQDGLPSAWMTGIATNYGGAQDGMVRNVSLLAPHLLVLPPCLQQGSQCGIMHPAQT